MGTSDTAVDPVNSLKRGFLNAKLKSYMWYRTRPNIVRGLFLLVIASLFLISRVNITIEFSSDTVTSATESEEIKRTKKVMRLKELLNPRYPILLDLDGIRDPNPVNLEEYKKELFKENMFNTWVSDRTPLNREHPDARTGRCVERAKTYIPVSEMPTVSVVFIFVDECLSVLLRSVISIINTVPARVLKDIILVDDASKKLENGQRLEEEVMTFDGIVKLVRHKERKGLMIARTTGAQHATGDVVVFLDSHIEATMGWVEPILDRISKNRKTVIQPNIPAIDFNTFDLAYDVIDTPDAHSIMGGFSWDMVFRWKSLPEREMKRRHGDNSVEVLSPTMAGGLFAMDRKYFFEIGAYDLGMDIWGAENLEISFRIWMCGGVLEINTCSTIGHVYRQTFPYSSKKDVGLKNGKRLAEVWLDEYKEFFYQISPPAKEVDMGDISERVALRQRLQCRSFRWYLENIYPEMQVPSRDFLAHGEIRNMGDRNRCVDNLGGWKPPSRVGMYSCHGQGGSQYWQYMKYTNEIKQTHNYDYCLDAISDDQIQIASCHGQKGNQHWTLTVVGELKSANGKCLSHDGSFIILQKCDGSARQRWNWGFVFVKPS